MCFHFYRPTSTGPMQTFSEKAKMDNEVSITFYDKFDLMKKLKVFNRNVRF